MPYKEFTDTMQLLDRLVGLGGYMVIYNSNYAFTEFPDAERYQNMAVGCNVGRSFSVLTADEKWWRSEDPDWKYKRGTCTPWGEFCFESGWKTKVDYHGVQMQPRGHGLMSFGCMYP